MKYGARNQIEATVSSVKSGDIMSQVKLDATGTVNLTSVMTTTLDRARPPSPDKVAVNVKAIHVLVVKE